MNVNIPVTAKPENILAVGVGGIYFYAAVILTVFLRK